MKLRNRRTGEIVEAHEIDLIDNYAYLKIFRAGDYDTKQYNSLAELNEDWEDYEESKGYWFINEFGTPTEITHTRENIYDKCRKNFGNYFKSKEAAEQAVEKLKAWNRLKAKGFVWQGWEEGAMDNSMCVIGCQIPENNWDTDVVKDLDLLFSEEEE